MRSKSNRSRLTPYLRESYSPSLRACFRTVLYRSQRTDATHPQALRTMAERPEDGNRIRAQPFPDRLLLQSHFQIVTARACGYAISRTPPFVRYAAARPRARLRD